MGFFKLITGVLTGIAAFGGSLLHQVAPRAERTPPPVHVEPSAATTGSVVPTPATPKMQMRAFSAENSSSQSSVAAKKEIFVLGVITEVGSSTVTIEQGGSLQTVELTEQTNINVDLVGGEAVIIIGEVQDDGSITALSIDARNTMRKDEPLPEAIGE